MLFQRGATFDVLLERLNAGAIVKRSRQSARDELQVQEGDRLLALVDPTDEPSEEGDESVALDPAPA